MGAGSGKQSKIIKVPEHGSSKLDGTNPPEQTKKKGKRSDDQVDRGLTDRDRNTGDVSRLNTEDADHGQKLNRATPEMIVELGTREGTTVEVHGLKPITTSETIKMFFENKSRSGGGKVDNVQLDTDNGVAYVAFTKAEDAECIQSRDDLVLDGANLRITSAVSPTYVQQVQQHGGTASELISGENTQVRDHNEKPHSIVTNVPSVRVVEIRGFQPNTSKDVVEMFIENKSSDVLDSCNYDKQNGVAVVSFNNTKGAAKLLRNDDLQLEGAQLFLTPLSDVYEGLDLQNCQPLAIRVDGISKGTTEKSLSKFFGNKTKSGGHAIEQLEYDSDVGVAVVTYKNANSVTQVLQKQLHEINQVRVKVTAMKPRQWLPWLEGPFEECAVVLTDVSPKCTGDDLKTFFPTTENCKIANVIFSQKPGVAMLQFTQPPDHDHLRQVCLTKPLRGSMMSVQKIAQTRTIQVHNTGYVTDGTLSTYFENKRSGGGKVKSTQICPEDDHALFEFAEYETVHHVIAKGGHQIEDRTLQVAIYHECIGLLPPHHDSKMPGGWIPKSVTITGFSQHVMAFLQGSPTTRQLVEEKLKETAAEVDWKSHSKRDNNIVVRCTVNNSVENAFQLTKDWKEIVTGTFLHVLDDAFAVEQVHVSRNAWKMYSERISYLDNLDRNEILIETAESDGIVRLTGQRREVEGMSTRLKDDLSHMQADVARAAKEVTRTRSGFTLSFLRMLHANGFESQQRQQSSPVKVCIDMQRRQVSLTGLPEDVASASTVMYNDILNRMTHEVMNMSTTIVTLTKHIAMMKFLSKTFHGRKIVAVYDTVSDNQLDVYALSEKHLKVAVETVKSETDEQTLDDPPAKTLITDEWTEFIKALRSQHEGLLKVDVVARRITLTGARPIAAQAMVDIERFLKEKTILKEVVNLECGVAEYIERNMTEDIDRIRHRDSVEITRKTYEPCGFAIRGTEDNAHAAVEHLKKLANDVKAEQFSVYQPGMSTFLASPVGQLSISRIESQQNVMIKHAGTLAPGYSEEGTSSRAPAKPTEDEGTEARHKHTTVFNIYARIAGVISDVRRTLEQQWDLERREKVYDSDGDQSNIAALSEAQVAQVRALCEELKVKVVIDQQSPRKRICLQGWSDNVAQATATISDIFTAIQQVATIAQQVRWKYGKDEDFVNYSVEINCLLERAYGAKTSKCEWKDQNGETHKINFDSMVETNSSHSTNIPIQRYTIAGGTDLPLNWSPMSDGEDQKLVPLSSDSREYQKVEKMFTCTAGNSVQGIHKIERVQNQSLYVRYVARREELQKQSAPRAGIERNLWHAARADTVDRTNHKGFSCGKNGTTIVVGGLDPSTTSDTILMFFENTHRSGGGPVDEVRFDTGDDVAQVTFQSSKVVKNVLSKYSDDCICLDEADLTVRVAASQIGARFVVNSNYATQTTRARPDAINFKRVYQALVLTGDYTTHDHPDSNSGGCRSALPDNPDKPGLKFNSLVDNVITPKMFTIFNDNQAYPNYLITFW